MADEVGRVLILSFTSNLGSLDAIKQIHGNEGLPNLISLSQHLDCYPWTISNKYFKTVVHLCHCKSMSSLSAVKASLMQSSELCFESIILVFNQEQKESLNDATTWMDYVETQNASVQLLLNAGKEDVAANNDQGLTQKEVLEWCLKYSFELVELKPNEEDQQDAGEFGEQTGFPRVIQALNCGEWPNIKLRSESKGKNQSSSSGSSTDDAKSNALDSKTCSNGNGHACSKTDEEKSTRKLMDCSRLTDDETDLLQRLGNDDPDGESFDELFTKLKDMKDRASTLPDEQRKSYAEQVAIAFWKAMGGEEDEISGLDDSD
ncbi:alpha- and gamma-adaptin-binding protein p34-like [Actinia tenebrosa]|uniref:Alpha- and gamma-adaptin-binding protein p34-like n=1 Tax=Actinia tenebrosa TaxID=6105 RepID=A0A6P8I4Q6_ACTTE|nr:alpha- and gamma-adaptin-binding protein p34-like [Actinia tenebrosa]